MEREQERNRFLKINEAVVTRRVVETVVAMTVRLSDRLLPPVADAEGMPRRPIPRRHANPWPEDFGSRTPWGPC